MAQSSFKAKSKGSSKGSKKAASSKKSSTSKKSHRSDEDVVVSSDDLGDVDIDNDDDEEFPKTKRLGMMGADMRREAAATAAPQPAASPKNKVGDDSAEFRDSQVLSMFRDDKKGGDDGDGKKGSFDDLSDILGVKAPSGMSRCES